jgi:hypothetical protein
MSETIVVRARQNVAGLRAGEVGVVPLNVVTRRLLQQGRLEEPTADQRVAALGAVVPDAADAESLAPEPTGPAPEGDPDPVVPQDAPTEDPEAPGSAPQEAQEAPAPTTGTKGRPRSRSRSTGA